MACLTGFPAPSGISDFHFRAASPASKHQYSVTSAPSTAVSVSCGFERREKCFCDGHHVSSSLQVKGYVHLHSLFGSKLALDPEATARANTIHKNGKTIKMIECRKMQSRHVNWKKFNATLPSSAKLWFRNISTPSQRFSTLDLCPESLSLVLARLTQD